MTTKDYELIARVLKRNSDIVFADAVHDMAKELKLDNPNFNTDIFLKAAGVEK